MSDWKEQSRKIWEILQSVSKEQKELTEQQKELTEQQKKTDERLAKELAEQRKELAEQQKKTDERLAKQSEELKALQKETAHQIKELTQNVNEMGKSQESTGKLIKELTQNIDGIGKSQGLHAESFFWHALSNKQEIAGISINKASRNLKIKDENGKVRDEYDIILVNGESIVLVELKYRVKAEHITDFKDRKIPNFKKYDESARGRRIYGAIGGFCLDDDLVKAIESEGFIALRQSGEDLFIGIGELKAY